MRGSWGRWLVNWLVLAVLSLAVRVWVVEPYRVDGRSMEPTLANGDRLLVAKSVYRRHVPARGDIVVFRNPRNPAQDYVKRVIALPGDLVEMRLGMVYINGTPLEEPYLGQPPPSDFPATRVAADGVFVLGDNRGHSEDSRYFGEVPFANIKGRVVARVWPFNRLTRPR